MRSKGWKERAMNCREARAQHTAAGEGRLSEAERLAYEAHLEGCGRCRTEAAEMLAAVRALRSLGRETAPATIAAAVTRRVRRPRALVPAYAWAPAAVVLAAVLLGYLMMFASGPKRMAAVRQKEGGARELKGATRAKAAYRLAPRVAAQAPAAKEEAAALAPTARGIQQGAGPQESLGREDLRLAQRPRAERRAAAPGEIGARRAMDQVAPLATAPAEAKLRASASRPAELGEGAMARDQLAAAHPAAALEAEKSAPAPATAAPAAGMAPTATGRGALGGAWVPADVASDHWGAGYGAALGAAAPGTVVINVETGKPTIVTLDARSAPVDEVLRQISSKTGTEITLRQKADTAITIHVTDTPTNVVKAVSLAAGLALEERGDTLVVGTEANK